MIAKVHPEDLELLGEKIKLDESKKLNLNIAYLFTVDAGESAIWVARHLIIKVKEILLGVKGKKEQGKNLMDKLKGLLHKL